MPLFPKLLNTLGCAVAAFVAIIPLSPALGDTMNEQLVRAVDAGELSGLHAAVVMKQGERIVEAYFPGTDERWGSALGIVEHGPNTLHDVRSVTKSIVGLLYGIALDDGIVPSLDTPLLDLFPEYSDLRDGSDRERMTVRDALTMQMGTEWDESLPYSDPRNSEIAMEFSEDRYRFVLDRPMSSEPGTAWNYNGGAVAVIARLIADGSDMPIDKYAQLRLFEPLGITSFEWIRGEDGIPSAASGLRLTARDLATIGVMVAQGGAYDGHQVVPARWIEDSSQIATETQWGLNYGYLWFLMAGPSGDTILIANGNGGQRLTVQPATGFVVSTFAGNYNDPNAWQVPVSVLVDFAIPEFNRHVKRKP